MLLRRPLLDFPPSLGGMYFTWVHTLWIRDPESLVEQLASQTIEPQHT